MMEGMKSRSEVRRCAAGPDREFFQRIFEPGGWHDAVKFCRGEQTLNFCLSLTSAF